MKWWRWASCSSLSTMAADRLFECTCYLSATRVPWFWLRVCQNEISLAAAASSEWLFNYFWAPDSYSIISITIFLWWTCSFPIFPAVPKWRQSLRPYFLDVQFFHHFPHFPKKSTVLYPHFCLDVPSFLLSHRPKQNKVPLPFLAVPLKFIGAGS